MSKVKWFKITTDIFDDEKIKLLEKMPDGDTIIVIWFKILTLSAKSNQNGMIMLTDTIPYTEEMLISYLDRKDTTIRLALNTFKQFGMLEDINEQTLLVSNWGKHQNVKGLDDIREQNRIRQQRYRDNQKLLLELKDKEEKEIIDIKNKDIEESNVKRNVTPKRFTKPTIKQVSEYCKERKNNINAEQFYDHYESVGWKVGKNPMKDWKASVRTWERRNNNQPKKDEPEWIDNVMNDL